MDSESKYHGIFDANNDGISIFYVNQDQTVSNFVEANKAAYSMLGYTKDEFLSTNVIDLQVENNDKLIRSKIESLKNESYINTTTKISMMFVIMS